MKELDDKAPLSPPFHGGDWGWWWATIKTDKGSGACKTHTHMHRPVPRGARDARLALASPEYKPPAPAK